MNTFLSGFEMCIFLERRPIENQLKSEQLDWLLDHCNVLMVSWLSTDRADQRWSGTAAAMASMPHCLVRADSPQASQSSCVSPQPPPLRLGWREKPALCQESAALFPTDPAIDRRAGADGGMSHAPMCRSRRACGSKPSRSLGRSLGWSKRLSTLSYLRRRE